MAHIKHVFPGGNTSLGFHSYYQYLPPENPQRIFILKGGPGVGKSTFMKKVGDTFAKQGFDLEHHHCSSDNNSLDGVVIPALGVAMIDGTAPHIVDPRFPGAIDELVDLGAYWDATSMEANRELILRSTREVSRLFTRGYRYLKAARTMVDDISEKHTSSMNFAPITTLTYELIHSIIPTPKYGCQGSTRHLFGSAFTPNGHVHFVESILHGLSKVYHIAGSDGTGKTTMLNKIATHAVDAGLSVEIYHAPLIPTKIETLVIPSLSVGFTSVRIEAYDYHKTYHLDDHLYPNQFAMYRYELEESHYNFVNLIENAIKNIRMAKLEHDSLEQFYVPNMNFELQQARVLSTTERIEKYIKKTEISD